MYWVTTLRNLTNSGESAGKMEKRTMRKFGSPEDVQPLASSRKEVRKREHRKSRDMETGNKF